MSEQGGEGGSVGVMAPVVVSEIQPEEVNRVENEIAAVTNGVDELQLQVEQLQEQLLMAEILKQNLQAAAGVELEKQAAQATTPDNARVQQLEHELQIRTDERENYRNKLEAAEKRIIDLQTISNANLDNKTQRGAVQETIEKMTVTLKEQSDQCAKFERQNTQFMSQVKALKEVISVHKDLLAIRKLESDQLKVTIKLLEDHAKAEKDRRNAVLLKMECAVKLNGELKSEYENQLRIFQDLRDKYNLKIDLLKAENARLQERIPVEQEPVMPVELEPVMPVEQEPAMPVEQEPAMPVEQEPAMPIEQEPALPALPKEEPVAEQ